MADRPHQPQQRQHRISKSKPKHKKLLQLPSNVQISKRPLLRPAIASPYAGARQQKVIYVSAKTPFLSAVKRVEKLLHLSDKRLVQSATTLVGQNNTRGYGKRKRGARDTEGNGDEIVEIAQEVERQKRQKRIDGDESGEEVVMKGTGKAIQKVMELALWFQQREEYIVRLKTGSVGAIDDITVDDRVMPVAAGEFKNSKVGPVQAGPSVELGAEDEQVGAMDVDTAPATGDRGEDKVENETGMESVKPIVADEADPIPETRIRYTSSLEVAVRLR